MNQTNNKDGLPKIAEIAQPKNLIFIVIALLIVGCFIGFHFYKNSKKKQVASADEVYVTQSDSSSDEKKVTSVAEIKKEVPVNREVSRQEAELQFALIQQKKKELQDRLLAPLMVVTSNQQSTQEVDKKHLSLSMDANTQFMNQVATENPSSEKAKSFGSLNTLILEGSLIHATLESAINTDLPGYLRASVSEPVYAEDGSQVLIPEGSRLIGRYKSGLVQGQSRIFIVWTRVITPNGASLQLGSEGVDSLGMAGTDPDQINRHFWQRFSTASLLSLIGAGAANVGVDDNQNSASAYREAVANSFSQSANESLQQDLRIPPTLQKYQGKPIIVFVAKDLDFSDVIKNRKSTLIF